MHLVSSLRSWPDLEYECKHKEPHYYYINFLLKGFSHVLVRLRVGKNSKFQPLVGKNLTNLGRNNSNAFVVFTANSVTHDLGFKKVSSTVYCRL